MAMFLTFHTHIRAAAVINVSQSLKKGSSMTIVHKNWSYECSYLVNELSFVSRYSTFLAEANIKVKLGSFFLIELLPYFLSSNT